MIRTSGSAVVITTRELSRRTGLVISDVLASGQPAIVTRHGRAVVMVIPVSGQLGRYSDPPGDDSTADAGGSGPRGDAIADARAQEIDQLSDAERSVYYALSDDPRYAHDVLRKAGIDETPAGSTALAKLEIKGLAKRTWSGLYRRA